jgi:CubicO group peptidase (beta-lactamase class C family)
MNFPELARVAAVVALAAGCSGPRNAATSAEVGADTPPVDALFASWDRPGSPGCALAVSLDGDVIYSRGYGYANLDYGIPVSPLTAFDVGSVTKQFVAASISMLELEGKLSLDDDVRRWLPELPAYERPIKLRHMIHHTSGLRDYLTLFPLAGRDHYFPISLVQILDMMSRQRALVFLPGERSEYSNTAYMMLALVVERASGKSLGEFAEERIFGPLEMDGSLMYDNYEEIIPRRATGYDRHDVDDIRMVHNYNFDVPGDGQLYTTVEDLLRWDNYLHGPDRPAIHSMMLSEGTLDNGEPLQRARGLYLGEYRGLRTVHHTGSSWGSRSVLMRFVKPGVAIAIACNDGLADTLELAYRAADHYLAEELAPVGDDEGRDRDESDADGETTPRSMTSDQLSEFTGTFFSTELDATYRFAVVDRGLILRIEQEAPLDVVPVADDGFRFRFSDQAYSGVVAASLKFRRGAGGAIAGFDLGSGTEQGIVFEKLH